MSYYDDLDGGSIESFLQKATGKIGQEFEKIGKAKLKVRDFKRDPITGKDVSKQLKQQFGKESLNYQIPSLFIEEIAKPLIKPLLKGSAMMGGGAMMGGTYNFSAFKHLMKLKKENISAEDIKKYWEQYKAKHQKKGKKLNAKMTMAERARLDHLYVGVHEKKIKRAVKGKVKTRKQINALLAKVTKYEKALELRKQKGLSKTAKVHKDLVNRHKKAKRELEKASKQYQLHEKALPKKPKARKPRAKKASVKKPRVKKSKGGILFY